MVWASTAVPRLRIDARAFDAAQFSGSQAAARARSGTIRRSTALLVNSSNRHLPSVWLLRDGQLLPRRATPYASPERTNVVDRAFDNPLLGTGMISDDPSLI
jgi:hypothetical protein